MLETLQIDYVLKDKNLLALEKLFNTFNEIIEIKVREHSYFSQYFSHLNDKCQNQIFELKNKAKAIKNVFSQTNLEKIKNDLNIKNHKMNLDVIRSMKKHFSDKADLFTKFQKKFFINNYLLLPLLQDLIDFTKYINAHTLILKRNYLSKDKKETHKMISEFFQNQRFRNLNKNLNLIESDSLIAVESYIESQNEDKGSSQEFLKSTNTINLNLSSKKCINFSLESYSNSFLNVDEFFKRNFNNNTNKKQFQRIIYCSDYIAVLRYFSLNFNKDFIEEKWNLNGLDRIYRLLKLIEKSFEEKIDLINKQFEDITNKFSGSNSYLRIQINNLQDKEEEIIKEIKLIDEAFFSSTKQQENEFEIKYLEDLIDFRTQYLKSEGSFLFNLPFNF